MRRPAVFQARNSQSKLSVRRRPLQGVRIGIVDRVVGRLVIAPGAAPMRKLLLDPVEPVLLGANDAVQLFHRVLQLHKQDLQFRQPLTGRTAFAIVTRHVDSP